MQGNRALIISTPANCHSEGSEESKILPGKGYPVSAKSVTGRILDSSSAPLCQNDIRGNQNAIALRVMRQV